MRLQYLSLTNFRNYARLELTLPERPVLLYGSNAQGKTSLLEAVYVLSAGSSPLAHRNEELLKWNAEEEGLPYARIWGEVVHRDRTHELEVILEKHHLRNGSYRVQKTIRIDGVRKRRADLAGQLNVVLFMPQTLELIAGSPSGRRDYLDDTLCQVDSGYCEAVSRYGQLVSERNAALRHIRDEGGSADQLVPFERDLVREGVTIIRRRRELIDALSQRAHRLHQTLTGGNEWLKLRYEPNFDPGPPGERSEKEAQEEFRETLLRRRREAIGRGVTVTGPHRDEMSFIAGSPRQGAHEVDLRTYGSRGQQRTAVLSLKLAELNWLKEQTHEAPVLLFDEVLAELDARRRRYLLEQVDEVEQALLTATDIEMFNEAFRREAALWEVEAGIISQNG